MVFVDFTVKLVHRSLIDKVSGNNVAILSLHHNMLGPIRLESQNKTRLLVLVYYID